MFITVNHTRCFTFPLVIGLASLLAALRYGNFKYEIKIKERPSQHVASHIYAFSNVDTIQRGEKKKCCCPHLNFIFAP